MISKEELTAPDSKKFTWEELKDSHTQLYDAAELARAITSSDDWLDLEELEDTVDELRKEVSQIQQDISAIKLQLTTKKDPDSLWVVKANKALTYKVQLLCRYQTTLGEKNTELKQLRRLVSTNNIVSIARTIMSTEQWQVFVEKLSNKNLAAVE